MIPCVVEFQGLLGNSISKNGIWGRARREFEENSLYMRISFEGLGHVGYGMSVYTNDTVSTRLKNPSQRVNNPSRGTQQQCRTIHIKHKKPILPTDITQGTTAHLSLG
jgi:hypothetical protein